MLLKAVGLGVQLGFSLKRIVRVAAAPITAPVRAAVSIVKGENVASSIAKGVSGVVSAPTALLQEATGGVASKVAGAIPLVGGSASRVLTDAPAIASYDAPSSVLRGRAIDSLRLGVVVGGAGALIGAGSIGAKEAIAGAFVGPKLLKGDVGAIESAAGDYFGIPPEVSSSFREFFPEKTPSGDAFSGAPTYYDDASSGASAALGQPDPNQHKKILAIASVVAIAIFIAKRGIK